MMQVKPATQHLLDKWTKYNQFLKKDLKKDNKLKLRQSPDALNNANQRNMSSQKTKIDENALSFTKSCEYIDRGS